MVYDTSKPSKKEGENGSVAHYIPVLDPITASTIAVLKFTVSVDDEVESFTTKDAQMIANTLGNAISKASKEAFADKSILQDLGAFYNFYFTWNNFLCI